MQRGASILIGITILALVASGLAEATISLGHRGQLTDDASVRPSAKPKLVPSTTPTPTAAPTATPTATPDSTSTATTVSFVHMRAGASTSTAILTDLNGGTVVNLGSYQDSQWQQVTYNGLTGYIFRSYLQY